MPPSWKGWHFNILLNARYEPLIAPCVFRTSIVYSEQVGRNLQLGPSQGEIAYWYILTTPIIIAVNTLLIMFFSNNELIISDKILLLIKILS